eukprot:c7994_g1_i2.p1 GENE.c7994_g1_i2~~c7994_g1_i2.p1  ORF type:complete len:253 (+),score=62.91 c7994_g1_i2:49-807(+)
MKFVCLDSQALAGFSVILPDVTIGNVGQLAADILIHNFAFHKIGILSSKFVMPMVGNDPFGGDQGNLSTPLEVFCNSESKLCLVQQRSPAIQGCHSHFNSEVLRWVQDMKFSSVWVISALDAQFRDDQQLQGTSLRVLNSTNTPSSIFSVPLESLGILPLEQHSHDLITKHSLPSFLLAQSNSQADNTTSTSPNVVCLFRFCVEGNNTNDGMTTAAILAFLLGIAKPQDTLQLKTPPSWQHMEGQLLAGEIF